MQDFKSDAGEEGLPEEQRHVVELAALEKYLHDPAFIERFVDAAANEKGVIGRTAYYTDEKKVSPEEFAASGYQFFYDHQGEYADEWESRLKAEIEGGKVEKFIAAFGKLWVDGFKARHASPEMMSIKASIRDHDRYYYPRRHVFVNKANAILESVVALFEPEEMRSVFDITTRLADMCIEDYLESRADKDSSSVNRLYLHRGIFPEERITDLVLGIR